MHLDELAIRVVRALLINSRLCRAGADHRVGALAEDGPDTAGSENDRVGREGADLHGPQVHCTDAAAELAAVEHGGEKLPAFILLHLAFGLIAADLLVERVEKLLAGGRAGKSGAMEECSAEAAKVEQSFGSTVE